MNTLKEYIQKYTKLTSEEWRAIADSLSCKTLQVEEILLREGSICRHLYFLESGLMRYFIVRDGKEVTKFFTEAPYCFTSQFSFTKELPANENIQAIEKSVVWQMSLQQANKLLEGNGWNTFVRKLVQEVQYYTESILLEIQTETAENRYAKMIRNNHTLLQRIPLKYLASYLGIAPQSLSRIRKNIMRKPGS